MSGAIGVRALGISHNDPLRGPVALSTLARLFRLPDDADGAGVASVVDGAALISHLRIDASAGASLAGIVGSPRGRTAIAQVSTTREIRPGGVHLGSSRGPFRARSWAAAVVGGPADVDEAAANRERLVAGLPDSLQRCLVGKSEGEAFFLAVLAVLHHKGALDRTHDTGGVLGEAVAAVDNGRHPRQVIFTNGTEVLHVARGMPSVIVVVQGLDDEIAAAVSPLLADSSTARERNRRYVGAFCVGALDLPLRNDVPLPAGCTVQRLPDGGAVLVGRDLVPRAR